MKGVLQMSIIIPGDAIVLKSYGFVENELDPLRYKKHGKNYRMAIEFNKLTGWSGAVYSKALVKVLEVTSPKLKKVLQVLDIEERIFENEIYADTISYRKLRRIEI